MKEAGIYLFSFRIPWCWIKNIQDIFEASLSSNFCLIFDPSIISLPVLDVLQEKGFSGENLCILSHRNRFKFRISDQANNKTISWIIPPLWCPQIWDVTSAICINDTNRAGLLLFKHFLFVECNKFQRRAIDFKGK